MILGTSPPSTVSAMCTNASRLSLRPLALTVAISATSSLAEGSVVVVPIPQAAGTTLYLRASLDATGSVAVLAADNSSGRLIRWSEATGALIECASPGSFSTSYSIKVTNVGTTTGGWFQAAAPFLRGGALWQPSGALSIGPFGGSGAYGESVAGSTNGFPYFITDVAQSAMYQLGSTGAPVLRGRPAGTTTVVPRDASQDGGACVLAAPTSVGTRTYRWTLATGFQQLPLPAGATEASPTSISDDGLRVVGVSTGPTGQQPFLWSARNGSVPFGVPAGATVTNLAASGDAGTVCGRYTLGGVATAFVWSANGGIVSASAFALSRCFTPTGPIEFLDFNADGTIAVARIGTQAVLLKGLGCRVGDFDRDGDVDAVDLASLLANWEGAGSTDLDSDGTTGAADLAMLLSNWT